MHHTNAPVSIVVFALLFAGQSFASHAVGIQSKKQVEVQKFEIEDTEGQKNNALQSSPADIRITQLSSGYATIHFEGNGNFPKCRGGHNVQICFVAGPMRVKLEFKGEIDTYELDATQYGVCYIGRLGSFCDIH